MVPNNALTEGRRKTETPKPLLYIYICIYIYIYICIYIYMRILTYTDSVNSRLNGSEVMVKGALGLRSWTVKGL